MPAVMRTRRDFVDEQFVIGDNKKFHRHHTNVLKFRSKRRRDFFSRKRERRRDACRCDGDVEHAIDMLVFGNRKYGGGAIITAREHHRYFFFQRQKFFKHAKRVFPIGERGDQLVTRCDARLTFAVVAEACGFQYSGQLHRLKRSVDIVKAANHGVGPHRKTI